MKTSRKSISSIRLSVGNSHRFQPPAELAYKVKSYRFEFDKQNFRYHIEPEEDELLSSWIVRLALAHLTDPATFVNLYMPVWRNILWTRDIDVCGSDSFLRILSQKSSIDYETIFKMTLKSYAGYLAETITPKTRNPLIQCLGNCSRIKIRYGQRFCPECLKTDNVPYFRKKWRLTFSTACIIHNCFLMDRCSQCGTPLSIYRRHEDLEPNCYRCGFRFSEAEAEYISIESYGLQAIKRLYETMDSGIFQIDQAHYVYSFLFFEVLKQFVKITYFWGLRRGFLDHEVMNERISCLSRRPEQSLIANIPLREQYLLFSGIVRLFENYPFNAITFCRENKLRKTELIRDISYLPWFFCKSVVDTFNFERYRVSLEEVVNARDYMIKRDGTTRRDSVAKVIGRSLDPRKIRGIKCYF